MEEFKAIKSSLDVKLICEKSSEDKRHLEQALINDKLLLNKIIISSLDIKILCEISSTLKKHIEQTLINDKTLLNKIIISSLDIKILSEISSVLKEYIKKMLLNDAELLKKVTSHDIDLQEIHKIFPNIKEEIKIMRNKLEEVINNNQSIISSTPENFNINNTLYFFRFPPEVYAKTQHCIDVTNQNNNIILDVMNKCLN